MKDEQEVPTNPTNENDPVMAAVARIEGKLDTLTGIARMIVDELQVQKKQIRDHEERISYLDMVPGSPA